MSEANKNNQEIVLTQENAEISQSISSLKQLLAELDQKGRDQSGDK